MTQTASGTLRGRHAVVTGGGRGIGAAIATALAADGATLTLMSRSLAALERHAQALRQTHGVEAHALSVDVTDPADVQRAFAAAVARSGAVHILINNAGRSDVGLLADISLEAWEALMRVNLTGPFLCIQQVLPAMIVAGSGRIVTVASTAGLKGYAKVASYCASKHGVVGLTRALAAETARAGITVNAVCPGYTDETEMLQAAVENVRHLTGRTADEARAILTKQSPRGTLITPEEVAHTVAWLCSPGASAITGQSIAVAAGEVMR